MWAGARARAMGTGLCLLGLGAQGKSMPEATHTLPWLVRTSRLVGGSSSRRPTRHLVNLQPVLHAHKVASRGGNSAVAHDDTQA